MKKNKRGNLFRVEELEAINNVCDMIIAQYNIKAKQAREIKNKIKNNDTELNAIDYSLLVDKAEQYLKYPTIYQQGGLAGKMILKSFFSLECFDYIKPYLKNWKEKRKMKALQIDKATLLK